MSVPKYVSFDLIAVIQTEILKFKLIRSEDRERNLLPINIRQGLPAIAQR